MPECHRLHYIGLTLPRSLAVPPGIFPAGLSCHPFTLEHHLCLLMKTDAIPAITTLSAVMNH